MHIDRTKPEQMKCLVAIYIYLSVWSSTEQAYCISSRYFIYINVVRVQLLHMRKAPGWPMFDGPRTRRAENEEEKIATRRRHLSKQAKTVTRAMVGWLCCVYRRLPPYMAADWCFTALLMYAKCVYKHRWNVLGQIHMVYWNFLGSHIFLRYHTELDTIHVLSV